MTTIPMVILFIFTHVNSGSTVHTQEFYTQKQCEYALKYVIKDSGVTNAWCINK